MSAPWSPLDAVGTLVEVYGPSPDSARWDTATWDDPDHGWDAADWRNVTGLAMSAEVEWGVDRQVGVLSTAAAGRWSVRSYDPLRLLDPSNVSSPYWAVLRPGTPLRIRYGALVVRTGWLDTIAYSHADRTGDWRASDAIPLLVQARVLLASLGTPPTTLRALARRLVAATGVPVTVETDPEDGDPLVGPAPAADTDGTVGLWDWLLQAASDSLRAAWVDPVNVLRFRPYGGPRDLGLVLGGPDGVPFEDLVPTSSLDAVYNVVTCKEATGGTLRTAQDAESIRAYGTRRLDRDRASPDALSWAANVLADRSQASLDYQPRTLRLRSAADLADLVATGMVDTARVLVESADPNVEVAASLLGLTLRVTPEDGWSADVVCYVPAAAWDDSYQPPVKPPDPIPPAVTRVTRTYNATKDSRLARTSGGANYGSGTEGQLPVGAGSGWRNRALIDVAAIPWGGVVRVVSATLLVTTSSQVNLGFGSSPKVEARRITGSWAEGSASSPSGSNGVVYPGPSTTTTGAKQTSVTRTEGARVSLDVTAIVRAWAAKAVEGGGGAAKYGIALYSVAEDSTTYSTEFLSRETGASGSRPVLSLVLDVTP